MDEPTYTSIEQCMVDIMANTDAPFTVVEAFADLVYSRGWTYDNGYDRRSVRFIQPGSTGVLFEVSLHEKHEFGTTYMDPTPEPRDRSSTLIEAFHKAGFPAPHDLIEDAYQFTTEGNDHA